MNRESDDDHNPTNILSEANFTEVEQMVERSVPDLHGYFDSDKSSSINSYFQGPLSKFNIPLAFQLWQNRPLEDFLKLPGP
jgi:hypothetical protein